MKIVTLIKAIIFIVVLLALISVVTIYSLYYFNAKESIAIRNQAIYKQLGLDLMKASDDLTNWARIYAVTGNEVYYRMYMDEVDKVKRRDAVVQSLRELNAPEEELALVAKALDLSNTLALLEGRAFVYAQNGDFETARNLLYGAEYDAGKQPIVDTLALFQKIMNERATYEADTAYAKADRMLLIVVSVFALIILIVVLSFITIYRKIRPVHQLMDVTDNIARCDFTGRVDFATPDELGSLAANFNKSVENVSGVLHESKEAVYEAMNANNTVVATMEQLSDTFQIQNIEIAAVAASMEEISSSSAEVKHNIESASLNVTKAMNLTKEGVSQLDDIMGQMETIRDRTGKLAGTIAKLGTASEEIDAILKVINDIADQTNLLALNAAIEAARAGDAGRGFAVVADEVRKLAERTQSATGEIVTIISALQSSSGDAIQEMGETELSIQRGVAAISATQNSFNIIVDSAIHANDNVSSVDISVNEQIDAINCINDSTQSIATGIEECANVVVHVTDTITELQKKAEHAFQAINMFKV